MFFRDGSYANIDVDLYFYPYLDTDDHIIMIRKAHAPFQIP